MIGIIKVIRVTYLESDVYEGSLPRAAYEDAAEELYVVDDIDEAVQVFERHGLSFAATGNEWAADPDGSYVSDYSTGERTETTAHFFEGFTPEDIATIIERVG